MAKQGISTGTTPNDGSGDSLLAGAVKINSNFDEVCFLSVMDPQYQHLLPVSWLVTILLLVVLLDLLQSLVLERVDIDTDRINVSGVVTASSFSGSVLI